MLPYEIQDEIDVIVETLKCVSDAIGLVQKLECANDNKESAAIVQKNAFMLMSSCMTRVIKIRYEVENLGKKVENE